MNQHLVLLDFDGTIANTFQDSPGGINVNLASRLAISEIFGRNGALAYDESGGLRNREPGELVRDISEMVRANGFDNTALTEWFVAAKLSRLIPEISTKWPQLYPGVSDFLQKAAQGELPAEVGILSSGHDEFIGKVLEINGIDSSKTIMVTSDLLRQRAMPNRPRYKPNTYQFAEAHRQWLVRNGVLPMNGENDESPTFTGRNYGKAKILYVGDDPIKDGGLAMEARVPFVFVPFTKQGFKPSAARGQMIIPDFVELDEILNNRYGDQLREGRTFAEVLFEKPDSELFPPMPEGELYMRIRGERST